MPTPLEQPRSPLRLLLTGGYGSGKSSLVMTLGAELQMIFTEHGGWDPALSLKDKFMSERQKIDVLSCTETPGAPGSGFEKIRAAILGVINAVNNKTYKWKYLCIDNLTGLSEQAFRNVLNNSGKLPGGVVPTNVTNQVPYTGISEAHYGVAMTEIENILSLLHSLPIGLIVIGHTMPASIDDRPVERLFTLGKKLGPKIPNNFSEVWYVRMAAGSGTSYSRIIQTMPSPSIEVKSRGSLADNTLVDTGMPEILKRIGY